MFTEPVWSKGTNQELWGRVICLCICPGNLFDSESTYHLKEGSKMSAIRLGSVSILKLFLLRFYSTDPCSLLPLFPWLKGISTHSYFLVWVSSLLPRRFMCLGVVSGILSGKFCLNCLMFNPRNSHLGGCVWCQLIHSVTVGIICWVQTLCEVLSYTACVTSCVLNPPNHTAKNIQSQLLIHAAGSKA